MKNFTKLLMAVVLLATYSCVQDTTEDLAPVVSGSANGSGEFKTLQAVLPVPSRTELGDSYVDAEGKTKYPVYWCEDDVLAVNGMPTTKINIGGIDGNAGDAVAVFDLPLGTTIPYNIVYPYVEGVAVNADSGLYPVVFLVNQAHTEGSFAQGSAPMYAWSNGFDDVHMHHLSAVLRFSIKAKAGETVDLKYVSVSTIGAEPIAGVFDVYCGSDDENDAKTGSLTAREGSTSTVFYNFEDDSFLLGDKEAVFYVVVPKGDYKKGFEVNFVANSGVVCARTFSATGDTELRGGVVREFPLIEEFTADHKMFLIGNDADMLAFATAVENGSFESQYSGGAMLVADVDVTGKGLKTIEGFKSLFEGRNYSIKGLTEPLFGENFVGEVSNLSVEGNVVESGCGKVGLIARSLSVDGDKVGRVFNCSAIGSIVYENADVTVSDKLDLINVGGAVGGAYGGEVSLTKCDVDVTINVAGPSGDATYKPCVGGVVGYACASGEVLPVVTNNTSAGTIVWDDQSESSKVVPFIGGVAGYVTAGTFTDNVNAGVLEIREAMYDLDWGGVIGASAVSVERCENKGSMTINEQVTTANIGGVLGLLEAEGENKPSIKDCENSGQILLNDNFKIVSSSNIGGVVAIASKGTTEVRNCFNSGAIEYKGSCEYLGMDKDNGNASIRLGGVAGLAWSELVENCGNSASANISVTGSISGNSSSTTESENYSGIGGVIGARLGLKSDLGTSAAVKTIDCNNQGDIHYAYTYCSAAIVNASGCIGLFDSDEALRCNNSGNMLTEVSVSLDDEVPTTDTTNQFSLYISGIFGYVKSEGHSIKECKNNGVVRAENCAARLLMLAGVVSQSKDLLSLESCSNSKDVIVGENMTVKNLYLGGIIASTYDAGDGVVYPNCSNEGNIICNAKTQVEKVYMGGIFGESDSSNVSTTITEGVYNSGKVIFTGSANIVYMGGYTGYYEEKYQTVQFVNNPSGEVEFSGTATTGAYVGGYVGSGKIKSSGNGSFQITNKGNVIAKGFAPEIYVSGGFGYLTSAANTLVSGLSNEGVVEVPALTDTDVFPTYIYLGGLFGCASLGASYSTAEVSSKPTRAIADCSNSGEVHYYALTTDGAYVGGIVGKAYKTPIYNCNNEGKIVSTGNAGDLISREYEAEGFALIQKQLWDHDLAIGGVVGETDSNVLASYNDATIEHTCVSNPLKIDQWGAAAPSRFDIGGVVGRTYVAENQGSTYAISLSGLTNQENGAITIYGSPYCTEQTSSIDWSSDATQTAQSNDIDDYDRTNLRPFYRMNLAGVVGRLHDHSTKDVKHFLTTCSNNAAITVPDAPYVKNLNMAGVLADVLSSHTTLTGCNNNGAIKINNAGYGTSFATGVKKVSYFVNLGGVVATCFDYRIRSAKYTGSVIEKTLTFNNCINNAPLHFGENRACFVQSAGGILGQALNMLEGRVNTEGKWQGLTWIANSPFHALTISMNNCENTANGKISFLSNAVGTIASYTGSSFAGGMVGSCGQQNHEINRQQRFCAIDLLISNCVNRAEIQFDRNNGMASANTAVNQCAVGGIVGYYIGGIGQMPNASYLARTVDDAFRMEITSCENHGRIWGFSGHIGGIVGCGQWYVKIAESLNKGDIVVARNAEAGNVIRRTGYGSKVIYAGGIAGSLLEYYSDTSHLGSNSASNEGWPVYPLGTQYVRVENCVNEGAVGATTRAGGIVGDYRSLLVATKESNKTHRGGVENCINKGDIYALEGATSQVGLLVGSKRMVTLTLNASYKTDEAEFVASKAWPIGVMNCQVSGQVLRGANRYYTADGDNYMNLLYGETWDTSTFTSIVEGEKNLYDGCSVYTTEGEQPKQ